MHALDRSAIQDCDVSAVGSDLELKAGDRLTEQRFANTADGEPAVGDRRPGSIWAKRPRGA
jgi:hypothetical protein